MSLALALKDGVLLTLVMSASSGKKNRERVSISLTSETRSYTVRPVVGGQRHQSGAGDAIENRAIDSDSDFY